MTPTRNKVMAEVLPEPEYKGMILLGEQNLEKHQAKVLAIGPEVKHIKVGDTVRFNKYSAQYFENKVFLREDEDILFVV